MTQWSIGWPPQPTVHIHHKTRRGRLEVGIRPATTHPHQDSYYKDATKLAHWDVLNQFNLIYYNRKQSDEDKVHRWGCISKQSKDQVSPAENLQGRASVLPTSSYLEAKHLKVADRSSLKKKSKTDNVKIRSWSKLEWQNPTPTASQKLKSPLAVTLLA